MTMAGISLRPCCDRCRSGGYVAAIRAPALLKVCLHDKAQKPRRHVSQYRCIPSKALLAVLGTYSHALHGLAAHGVNVGKVFL